MNIFEGGFEEPEVQFPDKIFTELTKDFSTVTEGLAKLGLLEVSGVERLEQSGLSNKRFRFKVLLMSNYLQGYSFEVFEFGYDISIFPVSIVFEDEIRDELGIKEGFDSHFKSCYIVVCQTEEEFKQKLSAVFATKRFKKIVGGLMKVARSKTPEAF